MATVRAVERRIRRIEGFDVRIRHLDGRDVRGDRQDMPHYGYERAMKNRANVRTWIERRFRPNYAGFNVEVLMANGKRAHGGNHLATVRDTYLED
jgi:hypothetical protein